jgi:hypothetical protein
MQGLTLYTEIKEETRLMVEQAGTASSAEQMRTDLSSEAPQIRQQSLPVPTTSAIFPLRKVIALIFV